MAPDLRKHPVLVAQLAQETLAHPLDRKILVCRLHGQGRELLRALARAGVGWIGFQVVTPAELAGGLVAPRLFGEGLSVADEYEQRAAVDEALDEALAGEAGGPFRHLGEMAGFRDAVWDALQALRMAGLGPDDVRTAIPRERAERRGLLARVLEEYVTRLGQRRWIDTAEVLRRASLLLEDEGSQLPAERVHLLPGLGLRGRTGEFLAALQRRGAHVLETDGVAGLAAPHEVLWRDGGTVTALAHLHAPEGAPPGAEPVALDLFAAATPADELREVLRRLAAAGVPWDRVEIVATDAAVYGAALDALAARLGVPVSFAVGLPLERSRHGQALAAYLRWLHDELPDDVLRRLLETEVLVPPARTRGVSGSALARRLRSLQIGWGRERYREVLEPRLRDLARSEGPEPKPPLEDERTPEEIEAARTRERLELEALRDLIVPILEAAPPVPDRMRTRTVRVSPARIAAGFRAFLDFVPDDTDLERAVRARLLQRLERLEATLTREGPFAQALSVFACRLELRIESEEPDGGPAPKLSGGGRLHLTDLEHGGYTWRPCTFVVGLDAGRFPGPGLEDPLLGDRDRQRLNAAAAARQVRTGRRGDAALSVSGSSLEPGRFEFIPPLATAPQRLAERHHLLAALLARLRGHVTLSYCSWDSAEGRTVPPAPVLLQALRLRQGDATLTYQDLHRALGRTACAVPQGEERVDASDVWLATLHADGLFLAGRRVVAEAFPHFVRGEAGFRRWSAVAFTELQGRIRPRAGLLDPRGDPAAKPMSASQLEVLGRCPLKYLYGRVLRLRPPDEVERDLGAWLDARTRGGLLHAVFERTLRTARDRGVHADDVTNLLDLAGRILDDEIESAARLLPPPSPALLARERERLRDDVGAFVAMVQRLGAPWEAVELRFGRVAAGEPPLVLPVPGGAIRLTGRIDRVDRTPAGGLRVIDYKTGSTRDFRRKTGVFHGGRRLQHVLYARAAEMLLNGEVEAAEFHFPTRGGAHHRVPFRAGQLAPGMALVGRLLDLRGAGHFPPTEEKEDCKFCDYRDACRVGTPGPGDEDSPPARWGRQMIQRIPEYAPLRDARNAG